MGTAQITNNNTFSDSQSNLHEVNGTSLEQEIPGGERHNLTNLPIKEDKHQLKNIREKRRVSKQNTFGTTNNDTLAPLKEVPDDQFRDQFDSN